MKRAALFAAIAVAAAGYTAKPANAIICVPVLQNCYCTFVFPCPTINAGAVANFKTIVNNMPQISSLIGQARSVYDNPMSVVSPDAIKSTSMAMGQQLLTNTLRGPASSLMNVVSQQFSALPIGEISQTMSQIPLGISLDSVVGGAVGAVGSGSLDPLKSIGTEIGGGVANGALGAVNSQAAAAITQKFGPLPAEQLTQAAGMLASGAPMHQIASSITGSLSASRSSGYTLEQARSIVAEKVITQKPLSQTEQSAFIEARALELNKLNSNALARAIVARNNVQKYLAENEKFKDRLKASRNVGEDFRANADMKLALYKVNQEANELMSVYLSLKAGNRLMSRSAEVLAPAPSATLTQPPNAALMSQLTSQLGLARSVATYTIAADKAREAHNALTSVNAVTAERARLIPYIAMHEARKQHIIDVETDLIQVLAQLYRDPNKAWTVLSARMKDLDRTTYLDGTKSSRAAQVASILDSELQAQRPTTSFGVRLPNRSCTYSAVSEGGYCPPYSTVDFLPGQGSPAGIASYYQQKEPGDPYRISPAPGAGYSSDLTGASYYLVQYWLEANKRKIYWDVLRRGEGNNLGPTTSTELWQEMVTTAPECLTGPRGNNVTLKTRPELFDIDPSCGHRTWSRGANAGKAIDNTHLGGLDRSLWMIWEAEVAYQAKYTGRTGVDYDVATAQGLLSEITASANDPAYAAHAATINSIGSELLAISSDKSNKTWVKNPLLP